MNKYLILYIIIYFLFLSCKINENSIKIDQLKTNDQIVILLNSKYKKIAIIELPIKIRLKNKSAFKKAFSSINYKYHPYEKGIGTALYVEQDDELIRIKQSKKKEIHSNEIKEYIIYSRHRVDTSKAIQNSFKSYISEMISKNLDTLSIGTLGEFKNKNAKILDRLVNKDSISLDMWQSKNIVIPVKF